MSVYTCAWVLVCILTVCFISVCPREVFKQADPMMVSPAQFASALQSSTSHAYFGNLGASDLFARRASSRQQYRSAYTSSLVNTHGTRRAQLFRLARHADSLCAASAFKDVPALAALAAVPWKFAELEGVEGGMPHTHADVICLPANEDRRQNQDLLRTLIHEKLHVLQRLRPDITNEFLGLAGYYRVCHRTELDTRILNRARSNPDLDQYMYGKNGRVAIFQLSDQPTSLTDGGPVTLVGTETDDTFEHPFEMMAHTLSELVVPRSTVKQQQPASMDKVSFR